MKKSNSLQRCTMKGLEAPAAAVINPAEYKEKESFTIRAVRQCQKSFKKGGGFSVLVIFNT